MTLGRGILGNLCWSSKSTLWFFEPNCLHKNALAEETNCFGSSGSNVSYLDFGAKFKCTACILNRLVTPSPVYVVSSAMLMCSIALVVHAVDSAEHRSQKTLPQLALLDPLLKIQYVLCILEELQGTSGYKIRRKRRRKYLPRSLVIK